MISLKDLNTSNLESLCNNAGIDMEGTNLLQAKFIKFDNMEYIYQVVASEDGDDNICICELSVTIDSDGDLSADFAGCPLFESNDMSAITDVWNEGPAVRLDDEFNPISGALESDSLNVQNLISMGR